MTRRLWIPLVLAGLAASLGGCNCNPPAKEMTVTVTSPKNGATVTMKEDVDNAKSGLQFEAKVATTNVATDGTGFAKVLVDGKASNSATVGSDGTAVVTVDASALASPDGAHVLQALAGDETGTVESAKVSVTLDSTELTTCTVEVSDPQSGARLNAKSDLMPEKAGVQSTVTVHTSGCGATGKIRVCMQGEGLTGTPCKGNVGIAVGEANISSTNSTTLTVDWAEGAVVVIGEHDNDTKVTDSAAVLVTVDSTGPTCAFVSPLDQAVLDSLNVDLQLKVEGAEAGQPVTVVSTLKPEEQAGTNTETGEVTIAATLPLGEQTLTATVTDASGNTGTCNVTITVDIEGCDVVLTDPPTGEYLFNIANASPGGTPLMGKYTIRGKTTRCPGGTAKFTKTINGTDSDLGTADVDSNGNFSRLLLFPDGEKDATLTVKIEKTGVASNGGTFFTYSTDFVAPTCTFVSPTEGATVTTQNPSVQLTVTNAEVDQDVVLATSAKPETMTGKMTEDGAVTIAASLPLGEQTLTVTVADQAKNSGTCSVKVTVDVAGCDVVLTDPTPTSDLVVNIANGNPSGTPVSGAYTIKGSTARCAGGTLTITKIIGGTSGAPQTATVASDGTFSVPVTFADAELDAKLNVKIDKAGQSTNAGVTFNYFTDFKAPVLGTAAPAYGNLYVVMATNSHVVAGDPGYVVGTTNASGVLFGVSVQVDGAGKADGTGGGSLAITGNSQTLFSQNYSDNSAHTETPSLVLPAGYSGTVSVKATDVAQNSATNSWTTVIDLTPCTVTLKTPATATVLWGTKDDKNNNPADGLQIDVVANTTDCKGLAATLTINGVTYNATADSSTGDMVFAISLPDGSSNLQGVVQMADAVGNPGSASFSASVVMTGAGITLFTDTSTRNLLNDRDYSTSGIQVQAIAQVAEVRGGTIYLCSTIPNSGSPTPCRVNGYIIAPAVAVTAVQTTFVGVTLADGQQTLYAESVDSGGNTSASTGTSIMVDSVPPVVTQVTILENNNPADIYLSGKELPSGTPANVEVTVTGAEGQTLHLYAADGSGADLGTKKIVSGKATISTQLGDGAHQLLAKVLSANGNPNVSSVPSIINTQAHLSVTVDRTAPNLAFTAPATGAQYLNKSADTINAATDTLEYDLTVSTDSVKVEFYVDGSTTPQLVTPTASQAKLRVALDQGAHSVLARAFDLSGNTTDRTSSFTVDTIVPTIVFSSPDPSVATPGQVFNTYVVPVALHVTGAETGRTVTIQSSATGGSVGAQGIDASGNVNLSVTLPNDPVAGSGQTLTASLTDLAGNPGSGTVRLSVASSGCQISLVSPSPIPAFYGAVDDKDAVTAGLQTDIVAQTSNCKGLAATLYVGGSAVKTVNSDGTSGLITFSNITLADGTSTVSVEMTDAGSITTSLSFTASVKVSLPTLSLLAGTPAVPATGSLYVVAPGNPGIDNLTYFSDAIPGNSDAGGNALGDLAFGYRAANAVGGHVYFKLNGVDVIPPEDITADPATATVNLPFPQDSVGTFEVYVMDPYGNRQDFNLPSASFRYPIVVDVVPPAVPSVTANLVDNRASTVSLSWTSPGDDGSTGSNSGYEVRYLTSTMAGTSFTCPAFAEASYATATLISNPPAGGTAGQSISFLASDLPPLNCYRIAVRSLDEVGNRSDFPADSSIAQLGNYWSPTTLEYPDAATTTFYGYSMVVGDFNKDGVDDLAVGARGASSAGAVYVYFGVKNAGLSNVYTVLNPPNGTPTEFFGSYLASGDVDGDGVDDLAVSSHLFGSSLGRAFIYFGLASQPPLPTPQLFDSSSPIEIRGIDTSGQFGQSLAILGDVNGPDGTPSAHRRELIIGAATDSTSPGMAYMFFGRSKADWAAARTSLDSSTVPATPYIPASAASRIFSGASVGDQFGALSGYTTLGDLNADGKADFALPASRDSVNRMYLFDGATVTTGPIPPLHVLTSSSIPLAPPSSGPFSSNGGFNGFGASSIGGLDFSGDSFPDLIVSHPIMNSVHVFLGASGTQSIGAPTDAPLSSGSGLLFFGYRLAAADLNNDSHLDLIVSTGTLNSTLAGTSTIHIYLGNGSSQIFGGANSILKIGTTSTTVVVGDFNADGKSDIAVGDPRDTKGKVRIYAP